MKALIVDDNPEIVDLISAFLEGVGEIENANNGRQAVEKFRSAIGLGRPFDLVCMDIKMPVKDGHSAVAEIRRIEEEGGTVVGDGTKIIMVTAFADRSNVMGSFWQDGCDAYLVKPFTRAALFDVLERLELQVE